MADEMQISEKSTKYLSHEACDFDTSVRRWLSMLCYSGGIQLHVFRVTLKNPAQRRRQAVRQSPGKMHWPSVLGLRFAMRC